MAKEKIVWVSEISYFKRFSFKKEFCGKLQKYYFRYLLGEEILLEKDRKFWLLSSDSHRQYNDCVIELPQSFVDEYLVAL